MALALGKVAVPLLGLEVETVGSRFGGNIVASLLGGMPATGAIARTATNVRNGGRTPGTCQPWIPPA